MNFDSKAVTEIITRVPDASNGLPEEIFLLVSRLTPLVNVDLLIKNCGDETLLTWRDDSFDKPGWHIPGGIIRFKENMPDRVRAVAALELEAEVIFNPAPVAINEIKHATRMERGHFISFLFACTLKNAPAERLKYAGGVPQPGAWAWHRTCPEDLIPIHEIYREYI